MEISREKLYELFSVGIVSEIILRVTGTALDIVKGLETLIRRLAAKNLALPCSRELEAQLLSHGKDVVTIMT